MCDDACELEEFILEQRWVDSESARAQNTVRRSFVDQSDDLKEKLDTTLSHLDSAKNAVTRRKTWRNSNTYVIAIIKCSEFVAKTALASVPAAGPVISAVTSAASEVFQENIAEIVFEQCYEYFEERFRRDCVAVCAKYRNIIRYLTVKPDAHVANFSSNLASDCHINTGEEVIQSLAEDIKCLSIKHDLRESSAIANFSSNLASDCHINTGEEVIQTLAEDIKCLSIKHDLRESSALMYKVHIYCCLSTLRELFLNARIVTEEKYGMMAGRTRAVLKGHWHDDSELLSFLYKPNRKQAAAFTRYLYVEKDWPVVPEFLSERQLYTTNLSKFDNKTVRIWSKQYPDSCLSFHNIGVLSFLRCHRRRREHEEDHTRFVLLSVRDGTNKFTLQPDGHEDSFVYNGFWVKVGPYPKVSLREWRIQEVLDEKGNSEPSYLIMLASEQNKCIFTTWTGRVPAKQISQSDRKCFWEIEILDT